MKRLKQALYILFALLSLLLVAFSQALSMEPDGTEAYLIYRRTGFIFFGYVLICAANYLWFMPRMAANGRFALYLLILFSLSMASEWAASIGTASFFRILSGASMAYVCIVGLSAPRLLWLWEDKRRKEERMKEQILELKVNEHRLKVDSNMMFSKLEEAERLCHVDPEAAVAVIYELSRRLRNELYGK